MRKLNDKIKRLEKKMQNLTQFHSLEKYYETKFYYYLS